MAAFHSALGGCFCPPPDMQVFQTNPSGKCRIRSLAYMNYKPKKITAFFCVNLLAAYAPAVLWIMMTSQWLLDQPGGPGKPTMLLTSPVWLAWLLITLMMDATSVAAGWCLLAAFILLFLGICRLAQLVEGLGCNAKYRSRLLFVAGCAVAVQSAASMPSGEGGKGVRGV